MAETSGSNVIAFAARDPAANPEDPAASPAERGPVAARSHQDPAVVLGVCRDRLATNLVSLYSQRISRASDELLAMADRATSLDQQQVCFSALNFLANRTEKLFTRFRELLVQRFDDTVACLTESRPAPRFDLSGELSLVDNDTFEQDLVITKLSTRAAFNCSQQLVALDRRLAALLGVQRVSQDDNPLHPWSLFSAMLQALSDLDVDRQLAMALLESFERQIAVELPNLYADINRYLAQAGVLPTIPLANPHQAASGAPAVGNQTGGGGVGAAYANASVGSAPGYGYAAGSPGPAGQGDIFGQLLRALQNLGAMQAGSAVAAPPGSPLGGLAGVNALAGGGFLPGWQAGLPGMSAVGSAGFGTVSQAQLVDALGELQRGRVDLQTMPGLGATPIDPAAGNALRQIRATPLVSASQPLDAVTIDIVAMLFDAIFKDPDLSAAMRAEIAKLQIPILKVALLDKTFFSDRKHPARRLLDAIANSGIGRGEGEDPRLVDKIRTIVEAVVHGFDADVGIFAAQVEVLEHFLHDEEARAGSKAQLMSRHLAAHERKELAPGRVASEIELRISRRKVLPLISEFVSRSWRLVLADVFVRAGEGSADWTEALDLMDELIWSVEPKQGAEERERLLSLLPDMLKRLRAGLERVDLDGVWDPFFGELIRLHMAALHRDAPPDLGPPAAPASVAPSTTAAVATGQASAAPWRSSAPADNTAKPNPTAATPTPMLEATDDPQMRLVQALEVGAWVEFQSERGTRNTLRLTWVSDLRRVYLFTNRAGENAMTLAATSLAEHLRKGSARLLSQNPLTDRAVSQVLEKVMAAAGGPNA